jgi:hypothetical protein
MIPNKKVGVGGALVQAPSTMTCSTTVTMVLAQPDRGRVAVMFFGRPAYYYAPAGDRAMVARLERAHAKKSRVEVEWDPHSLRIVRVDAARDQG